MHESATEFQNTLHKMKLVLKIPEFISHKNVIKLIIDCHGSRPHGPRIRKNTYVMIQFTFIT